VADKDDLDPTQESGDASADPTGQSHGSHALEPTEPAVSGVPADADAPTFRDRERLAAEGKDPEDEEPDEEPDELTASDDRTASPADPEPSDSDLADADHDRADADDDKELVAVGARSQELQAGDAKESSAAARARQKKEKATPRQRQTVEKERRTGPVKFVRESVSELQKVVYPTGQQLINYFIVVLIFVLFIIAIVSLLDLAFGKAIIAIFS
jgi:preprotein translocase subunit SecE